MTNYPYYIATRYNAGILKKINFGIQDGKKFKTLAECTDAVKWYYKNFPRTKEWQILILEYSDQYESKIIKIYQGDEWASVAEPIKLM